MYYATKTICGTAFEKKTMYEVCLVNNTILSYIFVSLYIK